MEVEANDEWESLDNKYADVILNNKFICHTSEVREINLLGKLVVVLMLPLSVLLKVMKVLGDN